MKKFAFFSTLLVLCASLALFGQNPPGTYVYPQTGGTTPPAGANTQVQFNNNGAFGGTPGFTWSSPNLFVNPSGSTGAIFIGQAGTGANSSLTIGGINATASITNSGGVTPSLNFNAGGVNSTLFGTATNCSSSASPAVCGSAAAGSVVVAAAATTVQVNTTAVTANSQILLTRDDSLGTKLGVTCNTATVMGEMKVSARIGGTSFTITVQTTPATNPGCIGYSIIN